MPAADAERQAFLCCYLALRMDLIEVVTGILPHLVTESNNNLCLGGGALNYAMQIFSHAAYFALTSRPRCCRMLPSRSAAICANSSVGRAVDF